MLFRLVPSMPRTSASGSGLWPTPTATPYGTNQGGSSPNGPVRPSLATMARTAMWATPLPSDVLGGRTTKGKKRQNETGLRKQVMFPTPTESDADSAARHTTETGASHPGTTLTDFVRMIPTPTANPAPRGKNNQFHDHHHYPHDLANFVKVWPTPRASVQDMGSMEMAHQSGQQRGKGEPSQYQKAGAEGGQLNPRWVCWLMGFPLDWFDGLTSPKKSRGSPKASKAASTNSGD